MADRTTAHTTPDGRTSPARPKKSTVPRVSSPRPTVRSVVGAAAGGRRRGRVVVGQQRPAGEVQDRADAVGEGEHDEREADGGGVDAEVAPEPARHARDHAVVAGPGEAVGAGGARAPWAADGRVAMVVR